MIPYGRQDVTEEDVEAVVKVLRSDFLTQGSNVPEFEQKLCEYTGAQYSVAVNSCTSALHIACLSLGLGPGDILWTSPITFVASANCALYCGASVDFIDVDKDTALINVKALSIKLDRAKKEGKLPKILIPVHFAGQSCDMRKIYNLSQLYGFKIIEDAAHSIGGKYYNSPVGSCEYSDITVFSFHPVKNITTGEGGAAMTNSSYYAEKMTLFRSHGITRDPLKMKKKIPQPWRYEQIELGYNYRMNDIQAALGISQLKRLDKYVSRRSDIVKYYNDKFKSMPIDSLIQNKNTMSSHHLYVILVRGDKQDREGLYNYFIKHQVGVNLHYMPIYKHPYYNYNGTFKGAEEYYNKAISLPIFPNITIDELNTVVDCVKKYFDINMKKLK